MTEIYNNQATLSSDPAADSIIEIVHGATKFKIVSQCLEMGFFDELETLGEATTAANIAKRCGYDPMVTRRLLDTLVSFQLAQKEQNNNGAVVYKNASATSKYLTRSRRPTMIGLFMMEQAVVMPMIGNLENILKAGSSRYDINKNVDDLETIENKHITKIQCKTMNNTPAATSTELENMNNLNNNPAMDKIPPMNGMSPMGKDGIPPTGKMPTINGMSPMSKSSAMNGMPQKAAMAMDPSEMQMKYIMATEAFATACAPGLVRAFDLSSYRQAVDLGCGSGRISFELSKCYPEMNITLLDLPPVVKIAQKLKPSNLDEDQLNFYPGNFLEDDLPTGDLFMLGHVVHGWDLQSIDNLLAKIFKKLPAGGSLLIMEKLLNEKRDGPELAMANDFMLSLMTKGQERCSSEYQKLLSKHGYTNMQIKRIEGFNYYDAILVKKPL